MTDDLFSRLQGARTPEERLLLVIRDLLENLSSEKRAAAWAAAVPHWFDTAVLAALLEVPLEDAQARYDQLIELPFVEPFAGRGHNVHELAREYMLGDWWENRREEYRALSARAAEHFRADETPEAQVEAVYHKLIADEDKGADALWDLGEKWYNAFRFDRLYSLAQVALEHFDARRIVGRGAGWTLFNMGRVQILYSRYREARAGFMQALELAAQDRRLRGDALLYLGTADRHLSEYPAARDRYGDALSIYREIGNRPGEANAIKSLGDVHVYLDEYTAARGSYEEALSIYREIGNRLGEANAIKSLGDVHRMLTDYASARECYDEALPIYREVGDRIGEANAIKSLGDVHVYLAEYAAARESYDEAIATCREIGDHRGEANAITGLGDVHFYLAEYAAAWESYGAALVIYREIGNRMGEANTIKSLGDVHVYRAEYAAARMNYEAVLAIYREIGDLMGEANALSGLGSVCLGEGDYPSALALYQDVERRFGELGLPYHPAWGVTQETLAELRGRLAEQPDLPGGRELLAALESWRG